MAKGAPDYTQPVEIRGFDGTTLKTLKVDTDGQLYAILRGIYGTTFKNVAVDDKGQLYVILRGASGNDVAVDANGFISAILKGIDSGGTLRTVRTDDEGRLIAMINALYGTTEKPLKCDADGNLYLNLNAQDLAYLVTKGFIGNIHTVWDTWTGYSVGETHTVLNIASGKGLLLIAHEFSGETSNVLKIVVDGNTISDKSHSELGEYSCGGDQDCVVVTDANRHAAWLNKILYFESSCLVQVIVGTASTFYTHIAYSLV